MAVWEPLRTENKAHDPPCEVGPSSTPPWSSIFITFPAEGRRAGQGRAGTWRALDPHPRDAGAATLDRWPWRLDLPHDSLELGPGELVLPGLEKELPKRQCCRKRELLPPETMSSLSVKGCKHAQAPVITWGVTERLEFSDLSVFVLPTICVKCLQCSRR